LNLKHGFGGDGIPRNGPWAVLTVGHRRIPAGAVGTPHLRGRMMRNHDQAKDE
jgi:hypothetical protein